MSSGTACGTDNLVANKRPVMWQDAQGSLDLATNLAEAPEGAQWDAPGALIWATPAGSLTYDLGAPTTVSWFHLQADANDTYKIFGSLDGTPDSFKLLLDVDTVEGHGLRSRNVQIPPATVRYLRVGEGYGDGFYSISEFAVYCAQPTPWPPQFKTIDAPKAQVKSAPWWKFQWWDDKPSARFEMVLAMAMMLLVSWGVNLAKEGMPQYRLKLRQGLIIAGGVLGLAAYFNMGFFHFGNYVHTWDTYHYYIGSKYFKELSYDKLYECATVADAEEPQVKRRAEVRKIMNLHTNILGSTTDILAHPERCKANFTPERWQEYKHDLAWFRQALGAKRWDEAQTDHGYNATPVWSILGQWLSNSGLATDTQIHVITYIDFVFVFIITGLIGWAFGWEALCVALVVFGTNFPSRFYWTGGSMLRWDWLLHMTAGVCLLKKERPFLGGFFLMYSGLLRIFPVFLFIGPVFALADQVWNAWKEKRAAGERPTVGGLFRKLDRRYVRLLMGGTFAVVTLIPLSLVTSGGLKEYGAFVQNTKKHANTPLTNYMGWRTIVAYRPNEAGRFLNNNKIEDAWLPWKEARLRAFRRSKPVYVAGILAFAALLYMACRGREPWVAAALSTVMIAVIPELTCYYYSFLIVTAVLYRVRKEAGVALLAITAATGFIDMAPTAYLPNWWPSFLNFLRMPTWLDEQYTWMSLATLIGLGWILYDFGFIQHQEAALALAGSGTMGESAAKAEPLPKPESAGKGAAAEEKTAEASSSGKRAGGGSRSSAGAKAAKSKKGR